MIARVTSGAVATATSQAYFPVEMRVAGMRWASTGSSPLTVSNFFLGSHDRIPFLFFNQSGERIAWRSALEAPTGLVGIDVNSMNCAAVIAAARILQTIAAVLAHFVSAPAGNTARPGKVIDLRLRHTILKHSP